MKKTMVSMMVSAGLLFATGAQAGGAAGATAACNDGAYSHETNQRLACSLHKGVKTWYGANGPAAGAAASATASAPVAGATGVVWVNTRSKHYHCSNDIWYGRTRKGAYLNEADAIAQGYRPDHKACSK